VYLFPILELSLSEGCSTSHTTFERDEAFVTYITIMMGGQRGSRPNLE
jgi:hypothetical protein